MKVFKIILAACIIFAAGLATGAMATKQHKTPQPLSRPAPANPPSNVGWSRERKAEYIQRLDKYLELTAEQKVQIEAILDQGNRKMAEHWTTIEPRIKEEYRACRKQISEILTPEQRRKQEEWRARKEKQKQESQGLNTPNLPDQKYSSELPRPAVPSETAP